MAKILIAGNTLSVKSNYTIAELKEVEKYRPKALGLYNEKGEQTFGVCTSKTGDGSVGPCGVSFVRNSADKDRKACVSMDIPDGTADVLAYAEKTIGVAIINLNKVEAGLAAALAEIAAEKAAVRANVEVL